LAAIAHYEGRLVICPGPANQVIFHAFYALSNLIMTKIKLFTALAFFSRRSGGEL
jgi:hypothetical protein